MKEKILELRNEGKSYNEIKSILGCSKSTISFHCGEGQKEKSRIRTRKLRKDILARKLESFKHKKTTTAIRDFQRREGGKNINSPNEIFFTIQDVVKKFNGQYKCYLTGKSIDINDSKSYHFDHILPCKQGGKNTLNNLGLLRREINLMKNEHTVDELIGFCKEILIHNGYTITKSN